MSFQKRSTSFTQVRSPSPYRGSSPSPMPPQNKHVYQAPSKESYFFVQCKQPIEAICISTNYLQQLPDDFKSEMLKFICKESRNGPSVYAEYDAPPNRQTVEAINGKGGYFLKKTAEIANIYLIWYNRQQKIYKFWGPTERAVRDAMNRIRGRIVKYTMHIHIQPQEPIQPQERPALPEWPDSEYSDDETAPPDEPEPLRRTMSLKYVSAENIKSIYERSDEEDGVRPLPELPRRPLPEEPYEMSRSMSIAY